MAESYNIYCDESCHLEHDQIKVMALGAVWCPSDKAKEINRRILELKQKIGLSASYEAKWTKISPRHVSLDLDIVDYFFDDDDLHFRGVVIPDKSLLQHERFSQTHDLWYYKMFFTLLKVILDPHNSYHIFLDMKDTRGEDRICKLHEVISSNFYDFSRSIVKDINLVRSHQVNIVQVTDILTGALTYLHRGLSSNLGKQKIVERIVERSGYNLFHNTLYRELKFNLLVWKPQVGPSE